MSVVLSMVKKAASRLRDAVSSTTYPLNKPSCYLKKGPKGTVLPPVQNRPKTTRLRFVAFPALVEASWGQNWTRGPQLCGQGHLEHQNWIPFAHFSLTALRVSSTEWICNLHTHYKYTVVFVKFSLLSWITYQLERAPEILLPIINR